MISALIPAFSIADSLLLVVLLVLMTTWAMPKDVGAQGWDRMAAITPKGYVSYYTDQPPRIDGRLDDAAWQDAAWTDAFVDIEGDIQPNPPFETRAAIRWDDTHLYIAARMEEPHVWGTLTEKNSVLFQDNDFEVFIDPDGDHHNYYELEINALNTIWELTLEKPYRDGGPAVSPTNIEGLRTAVHVDGTLNAAHDEDRGWSVELAIPWEGLARYAPAGVPPQDGEQWRFNFSRVEWDHEIVEGSYRKVPDRPEHNWVWSPQGVVDMHRPERWGFVQFSRSTPGEDTFRPDPALAVRDRLMSVYYAQRAYRHEHEAWASSLDELDVSAPDVTLTAGDEGFTATMPATTRDGDEVLVSVDHESRISTQ